MARIRSVHPGQPKDEDFVELSPYARLLAIFLRNLADDRGAFEWKPKSIKMEVFPADNLDMEPLLAELVEHRQVCRYEAEGKAYGAIRNFRKWQRPEKPKYVHPFDDALLSYVGLSPTPPILDGRTIADRSPTPVAGGSAISLSDEGGRRKEEGKKTSPNGDVSPSPEGDAPTAEGAELSLGLPPATPPPRKTPLPLQAAFDAWNEICGPTLGMVQVMTEQRRKHLAARLEQHFAPEHIEGWRAYCRLILESPFLTGRVQGNRPWRCDFDFAVSASGAAKILEGKYHDQDRRPPPGERPLPPGTV